MTMNGMNYTESFAWKMNIQRLLIFKLIQKALGWTSSEEERGLKKSTRILNLGNRAPLI